ncbi:PRC-barrel domain-containing protein [Micromonospora sp. WMMD882]|uniref:PRC-barrel domain-containing protein n=1 Tax=Micromonospora sp. WMMD882 TaxID=3015151 RepID=UPI00248CD097|nr:PRC-barrel domain-containing protein [Micromonospora sp. WMMD882]WBB81049.1 PRC-barrel domain-containing protein [Micromonospora sp. WMMD882]
MTTDRRPPRVSDLIGVPVAGPDGRRLGRVVDVVAEADRQGRLRLTGVLVTRGPWGRLLGYERDGVSGPWLVEAVARWIIRRRVTRLPWSELPPDVRRLVG